MSEVTASVFLHAYTQEESAYHLLGPVEIRQTKMQKQNKQTKHAQIRRRRNEAAADAPPSLLLAAINTTTITDTYKYSTDAVYNR